MRIWHLSADVPRWPVCVRPDERVTLQIGTWPVACGQAVWVEYWVEHSDRTTVVRRAECSWQYNEGDCSYWRAELGAFVPGDRVVYAIYGYSPDGLLPPPVTSFSVGPEI